MSTKYLNDSGLSYFWSKLKAYFAPKAHTHNAFETKHSYTAAANAAKNWYRIANANTSQTDTTKPIHAQFILTAYNASYATDYYERWFVNAEVFGRTAHIVILGNHNVPFSQARILYENTVADLDANDRPTIDIYLNHVLPNGTTKIEIEEVYNQGWTFVADGQLAASTIPTGFESVTCDSIRNNGVGRSNYSDWASYTYLQRSNFTANFTLADNNTYRAKVLNCTGTITVTVPSLNSVSAWFIIKNFNTTSGVITIHPSTTSVLIDGSNANITLQPGEYIMIHSKAANAYTIVFDGRWKSQKANASHNQASNTINAMTGYSKPSSASAIGTGDTLNAAIGKLEYKVDAYDDGNYVHKTGDETITGTKTFSGSQSTNKIAIQNSSFTKGTYPSEHTFWALYNCDANGAVWPYNVIGMFETDSYPDGTVATYMRAMKNASGNVQNASYVACYYDTVNDIAYATCPTPSFSSDDLTIATTQWVRHASGSTTLYSWGFAERGALGENYEMSVSDFDGGLAGGAWRVGSFKANTASAPSDNVGDFTLIRLYDGADQFASFICSSPRTEKLFFGRFWNGAWQGWRDIFTTTYNLVFAGTTANTVKLNRNTDSLYLVGGTSIDNNSFLALAGSQNSGVTAGAFYLHAKTGSNADKTLGGTPGGTLQWNGQNIQTTSDQRLKTKLESIPDEVLDAWEDVEWGQFRYLEAVAEKGGNARLHSGLVSQQVQKAFSGRGLDACAYGLVCHETRDAVDEDVVVETCPAYTGEDGVFHPEEKTTEHRHEDAVDLWMIRYAEALCMEASYMRRENARLKKRVADLEDRLAALELRPGSE